MKDLPIYDLINHIEIQRGKIRSQAESINVWHAHDERKRK